MAVRACLATGLGGVVEGKVASGRNSAAVAPPALIEYRALRAAAQSGSGASIAISMTLAEAPSTGNVRDVGVERGVSRGQPAAIVAPVPVRAVELLEERQRAWHLRLADVARYASR